MHGAGENHQIGADEGNSSRRWVWLVKTSRWRTVGVIALIEVTARWSSILFLSFQASEKIHFLVNFSNALPFSVNWFDFELIQFQNSIEII